MEPTTSFSFRHGLGDCANFARLVKLYAQRGHRIQIETDDTKAPLFKAAGAEIVDHAEHVHGYPHAPHPGPPTHADHWSGNKLAWNVSHAPLPPIGGYWDRWDEICAVQLNLDDQITTERETVASYYHDLPRPVVLCHFQGNTSQESKNLSHAEQEKAVRVLLDQTDGTVILLDWDSRVFKLNNWRVRHLGDDWKRLSTLELYEAVRQADLVLGIDSGVLHFTNTFTRTPALGIWTHHQPSTFAVPRRETLHVVPSSRNEITRFRRFAFNIVESPGDRADGSFIAAQAVRMLGPRRYLPASTAAEDCVLWSLVEKTRTFDAGLTSFVDRHRSFDALFNLASERGLRDWVETGTVRSVEDWTAGFSTYLFGYYLKQVGGRLASVDLNEFNCEFARQWTAQLGTVTVHASHSHDYLKARRGPIDVAYLDSADVGTAGYQECALEEAKLALPHLHERSLILFDDSAWGMGRFRGKGGLAIPYLLDHGWRVAYAGYQVLLTR